MTQNSSGDHTRFMTEAVKLARKGMGRTSPNPPVGAVVVKDGKIVGRGWHKKAGGAHAEVAAIRAAGSDASDSSLYVTLEPCSTVGRTGACTEAVLQAGLSSVFVGSIDPNPRHKGRGVRILRNAGLKVEAGTISTDTDELIRPFSKWVKSGRPYVTLKMAMSMDGRIADRRGKSKWISCPASRSAVKRFRGQVDAVMVGANTVRDDNPTLRPTASGAYQPLRVVLSTKGRIPYSSKLLVDSFSCRTIVVTGKSCPSSTIKRLSQNGATIVTAREKNGKISLKDALRRLGNMGVLHIYCEGGGAVAGSLIADGLVDSLHVYSAPFMLGCEPCRSVLSGQSWTLASAPQLTVKSSRVIGRDLFTEYRL